MINPWKPLCMGWKRDYKILRFAVDVYRKLMENCYQDEFTTAERDLLTWCKFMEYDLDSISNIEDAYRDYLDKKEGLYE